MFGGKGAATAELSTLEGLGHDVDGHRPRRPWLHAATTPTLVVVIGLVVVDGLDWLDVYGVDT